MNLKPGKKGKERFVEINKKFYISRWVAGEIRLTEQKNQNNLSNKAHMLAKNSSSYIKCL